MNATRKNLERVSSALQGLYQTFGYQPYKVSNFEEYDLYAQNKEFLASEQILSFSDTNGHLMALKPDITLSIIKNTRDDRKTRKVWYTESVYRVPRNAYGFQEILQTGLECLGTVDRYAMSEVLMLAARSLEAISPDYVLDVSHMGIVTGLLEGLDPGLAACLLTALGEKNAHTIASLCQTGGVDKAVQELLLALCPLCGPVETALPALLALPLPETSRQAAQELSQLCQLLSGFGSYPINLDLSLVNHTDYYNGLLFRGFVDGIAACVLSGGRYDHLLNRMGKSGGAIGFAVYLNELERFFTQPAAYDVDVLLTYGPEDDLAQVVRQAKALTQQGRTVRIQPQGDTDITYQTALSAQTQEAQS
jgi:ATP phosphoribosyltransferase regulatory subunit